MAGYLGSVVVGSPRASTLSRLSMPGAGLCLCLGQACGGVQAPRAPHMCASGMPQEDWSTCSRVVWSCGKCGGTTHLPTHPPHPPSLSHPPPPHPLTLAHPKPPHCSYSFLEEWADEARLAGAVVMLALQGGAAALGPLQVRCRCPCCAPVSCAKPPTCCCTVDGSGGAGSRLCTRCAVLRSPQRSRASLASSSCTAHPPALPDNCPALLPSALLLQRLLDSKGLASRPPGLPAVTTQPPAQPNHPLLYLTTSPLVPFPRSGCWTAKGCCSPALM